jgi:hypothetical protein
MGQLVYIKAKTGTENYLNKKLKEAKINNCFITAEMNQNWLDDINTNPNSKQKHLKPKDRDLTLNELKDILPIWTEEGLMWFDVAFNRTTQKEATKYATFIEANTNSLEYLKGAESMLERFKLTPNQVEIIKSLNQPTQEPEMLPENEQIKPTLQSGLFLCKSWSNQPFWVIFGNVDKPKFMKTRIYKEDIYNNIYRDEKGFAYLMLPLLPINNKQVEFVIEVYKHAANLGLRENFYFIIPLVYNLDLVNLDKVIESYKETYTLEELQDRFKKVFSMTNNIYPYNGINGFVWKENKKMFVPTNVNNRVIRTKCSILTALVHAMNIKVFAKLMSEITKI